MISGANSAGKPTTIRVNDDGTLLVGGGSGAASNQVQGNVASGAPDVGNPVKVGGEFLTTLPTLTSGQRGDMMLTSRSELIVSLSAAGSTVLARANNSDAASVSATSNNLGTYAYNSLFNGTTWDRARGNTAGSFVERTAFFAETATALAAAATLTGATRDNTGVAGGVGTRYKNFVAEVFTDQAGTLYIDKSTDGITWRQAATAAVTGGVNAQLSVIMTVRYYRMRYVNGATTQTVFLPTTALVA